MDAPQANPGYIPPQGDAPTADLEFLQNDGWVNYIGHTLGEIDVVDGALRCDVLNRHDTHTQTLMPVSFRGILPPSPTLTRQYLRMPFAWPILGKQFLVIGRRA